MGYKVCLNTMAAGALTAVVCVVLLVLTSLIPKEMIYEKTYESAVYFEENELFPFLKEGVFRTRQDNYADCILTHIIYQVDSKQPVRSVLEASYYSKETENVNVSFINAIEQNLTANTEYVRYWHGSMVFLRPLLIFLNITQIRVLLGSVVGAVLLLDAFLLYKKKEKKAAVTLIASVLLVHGWMIAASIEYVTTFLVMAVVLFIILISKITLHNSYGLFAAAGVVSCFVDFLTTETITFTIPMALLLLLGYRNGTLQGCKEGVIKIIKNGLVWVLGYACMFLAKWTLAAIMFGKETLMSSLSSAGERLGGQVYLGNTNLDPVATKGQQLSGALWHNIGCLFPFEDSMHPGQVALWVLVVFFVCVILVYMFRLDSLHGELFVPMSFLSLIPYLRYLVLSNHSFVHYFFTYRAQMITVFTLILFVITACEPGVRLLFGKRKK